MQTVTVRKSELTDILMKNRKEHRAIFLEAQKKYREKVIEILDHELKMARENQPFSVIRVTAIVAPQDHTKEYDRAIGMLSMEVGQTVDLAAHEYSQYVDDNWGWSRDWAVSNSGYVKSPKIDSILSATEEI